MQEGTGFRGEPSFGGRHVLILVAVFSVLFGISVGASLILRAEQESIVDEGTGSQHDDGAIDNADAAVNADVAANAGETVAGDGGEDGVESDQAVAAGALLDDRPLLAVVIDDWGYGWSSADDFLALPVPLNIAVIPYLPYSRYQAEQAASRGHQVILHLPMEPLGNGWDLGDGAVTTAMADDEIVQDVRAAWLSVPHVSGVNNHMGSKATADRRVVAAVLSTVKDQGAFFLDSRTTSESVVAEVAERLGVRSLTNDRFLDADSDSDPKRVEDHLVAAARLAKARGWAIVIGHVQPHTYAGLVAALPRLEADGVRLARLEEVLSRVEDLHVGDSQREDDGEHVNMSTNDFQPAMESGHPSGLP